MASPTQEVATEWLAEMHDLAARWGGMMDRPDFSDLPMAVQDRLYTAMLHVANAGDALLDCCSTTPTEEVT